MTRIIKKVGAIILDGNKRILVVKKEVPGRDTYIIPGGRPEGQETEEETLRRELHEELGVDVVSFREFGKYVERAEFEDAELRMTVFDVVVEGEPSPRSEIVSLRWVGADYALTELSLGSTLTNHVIPGLVRLGRM